LKTACGSPCYAAPEMIAGKRYQGSNVDIWSCGVILFALVCGYLPFEDPNTANLYKKILNGEYTLPKFVSPEGRDMITNILNTDPEKRFRVSDIRKHSWFNQVAPQKVIGGLFIGLSQIPINNKILDMLMQYNFKKDYALKCLNANKHNHVTTTYYLLHKRHDLLGEINDKDVEFFSDK
jgi:5'-AMP-activated protein kinase catalytic alpha subunit